MTRLFPATALAIGFWALLLGGAVQAQDLSAGMTPEQLFHTNCAVCHSSPRGLAAAGEKAGGPLSGLENFLAQHYTASGRSAQSIADYLKSVGGSADRARSRPSPHRAAKSSKSSKSSKPKKPAGGAKMTDKKSEKSDGDPKAGKPAMSEPKPEKKKPVSASAQAKREKPKGTANKPAEKKTD